MALRVINFYYVAKMNMNKIISTRISSKILISLVLLKYNLSSAISVKY